MPLKMVVPSSFMFCFVLFSNCYHNFNVCALFMVVRFAHTERADQSRWIWTLWYSKIHIQLVLLYVSGQEVYSTEMKHAIIVCWPHSNKHSNTHIHAHPHVTNLCIMMDVGKERNETNIGFGYSFGCRGTFSIFFCFLFSRFFLCFILFAVFFIVKIYRVWNTVEMQNAWLWKILMSGSETGAEFL